MTNTETTKTTKEQTPYERGLYEGSRRLPFTLYAAQKDQNEYERGRQDGGKRALAEGTFSRIDRGVLYRELRGMSAKKRR
jgi:hypothetical protein